MLLDIIAGARPNFMKIAPILAQIESRQSNDSSLNFRLVHTGQHYDAAMSGNFFADLGIPEPDLNLGVGSGTQAEQTAAIMVGYEKALTDAKPDLCLVVGDVTSTMACAITARKAAVSVAHVEAGIRSGDWTMPEEINRIVTDSVSNWFYTTGAVANNNLVAAGVSKSTIKLVGNTMIDTLLANRKRFRKPKCWDQIGLETRGYIVLTMHRPANVDDVTSLVEKLSAIATAAQGTPIVFAVHPRTSAVLSKSGLSEQNLHMIPPLGYLEFNYLVSNALGVITDSGGITEETTVLGIPCMTLRDSTERPETVSVGTNELVGTSIDAVKLWTPRMVRGEWKTGGIPDLWDGRAAERIVDHIQAL